MKGGGVSQPSPAIEIAVCPEEKSIKMDYRVLSQLISMGLSVKPSGIEIPDGEARIAKPFLNIFS